MVCALLLLFSLFAMGGCTRREEFEFSAEDSGPWEEQAAQTEKMAAESVQAGSAGGVQSADADKPAGGAESDDGAERTILVHVCGAVKTPGVYELEWGSRVYEAVQAAGGFTEEAEENYVNQAQELSDGAKLVIPTQEEVSMAADGPAGLEDAGTAGVGLEDAGAAGADDGKININTASESELCGIPGIGATRAAAIAAYRQENGGFAGIEDIMKVAGIKEGTYEKIKDYIKVR